MNFVFLGLLAVPLALILYAAAVRLGHWAWVPDPSSSPANSREPGERPASVADRTHLLPAAGLVAVVMLAVLATWPKGSGSSNPSQPARSPAPAPAARQKLPPLRLPPGAALKTEARISNRDSSAALADPRDIAVDAAGNLYVADDGNHRIVKLDPKGSLLAAWTDSAGGKLKEPVALAATSDGIIVADNETGQVHKYAFDGQPVATFEHNLGLFRPRGVSVDARGNVYVADTGNNRLVELNQGGVPVADITANGFFDQPTAVAFDDRGNIYVAEPDANRLDRLTADGAVQTSWPMAANSTVLPPHLLWLAGQGLIASQPDEQALALFSGDGQLRQVWSAAAGQQGALQRPLGMAFSPDRKSVWVVSNHGNELVQLAVPEGR